VNVFDQKADRSGGVFWLKDIFTPDETRNAGLLSYAGAEFEFPTCPALVRGVQEAAARGIFGYALSAGKYQEAVQWWMQTVRGYAIAPQWVVTTHGTIFSLATTIRMQTNPGENIIILTPTYNRYEQAATRLGRGTVKVPFLRDKGRYALDWSALEAAMSAPENKVLVLCNPNNPTGHILSREELARIAELSAKYSVTVFSDEIFADVSFGDAPVTAYTSAAGKNALAITCTSMGKTFSLTGVNHANVIIENDALRDKYIAQRNADHYGSIDPMHASALMAAYSPEGHAWLQEMKAYVWENFCLVEEFMQKYLPAAKVTKPEGTFVIWVDYSALGMDAEALEHLLVRQGCFAGDMGDDYYGPDTCVRYSLAVPRKELEKSLDKLAETLLSR